MNEPYIVSSSELYCTLDRLDLKVVKRIRGVLVDEGKLKMTNLATRSNVQYNRLVKYVNWLNNIKAVSVIHNGKQKEVMMTEDGKKIFENLVLGI